MIRESQGMIYAKKLLRSAVQGTNTATRLHKYGTECLKKVQTLFADEASAIAAYLLPARREGYITPTLVAGSLNNDVHQLLQTCGAIAELAPFDQRKRLRMRSATTDHFFDKLLDILEHRDPDTRPVVLLVSAMWVSLNSKSLLPESSGSAHRRQHAIARELRHMYLPILEAMGLQSLAQAVEIDCDEVLNPRVSRAYRKSIHHSGMADSKWRALINSRLTHLGRVHGLKVEISSRLKTPVSLWRKLTRTGKTIDDLYDIVAFRAVVKDVPECYEFMEAILAEWPMIGNEFDDYIQHPKQSGYQALHVSVWDTSKQQIRNSKLPRPFEIQIRSQEMHYDAEYGICAHWIYKDNAISQSKLLTTRLHKIRNTLAKGGADRGVLEELGVH